MIQWGYGATTFERIATATGMSVGAIQYHFNDRSDIFYNLYQAVFDKLLAQIEGRLRATDQRALQLREAIRGHLAWAMSPDGRVLNQLRQAARYDLRFRLRAGETIAAYDQSFAAMWRRHAAVVGLPQDTITKFADLLSLTSAGISLAADLSITLDDPPSQPISSAPIPTALEAYLTKQTDLMEQELVRALLTG